MAQVGLSLDNMGNRILIDVPQIDDQKLFGKSRF